MEESTNESCLKKPRIDDALIKIIVKWNNAMYHLDLDPLVIGFLIITQEFIFH